jgi:hypothetical protein
VRGWGSNQYSVISFSKSEIRRPKSERSPKAETGILQKVTKQTKREGNGTTDEKNLTQRAQRREAEIHAKIREGRRYRTGDKSEIRRPRRNTKIQVLQDPNKFQVREAGAKFRREEPSGKGAEGGKIRNQKADSRPPAVELWRAGIREQRRMRMKATR